MKTFENLHKVEVSLDKFYTGRDVYLDDYVKSWVEDIEEKYQVQLDFEKVRPEVGKDLGVYLTGKLLVYADDVNKIKKFVKAVLGKELDVKRIEKRR